MADADECPVPILIEQNRKEGVQVRFANEVGPQELSFETKQYLLKNTGETTDWRESLEKLAEINAWDGLHFHNAGVFVFTRPPKSQNHGVYVLLGKVKTGEQAWDLTRGKVESGATFGTTAQQELLEESGGVYSVTQKQLARDPSFTYVDIDPKGYGGSVSKIWFHGFPYVSADFILQHAPIAASKVRLMMQQEFLEMEEYAWVLVKDLSDHLLTERALLEINQPKLSRPWEQFAWIVPDLNVQVLGGLDGSLTERKVIQLRSHTYVLLYEMVLAGLFQELAGRTSSDIGIFGGVPDEVFDKWCFTIPDKAPGSPKSPVLKKQKVGAPFAGTTTAPPPTPMLIEGRPKGLLLGPYQKRLPIPSSKAAVAQYWYGMPAAVKDTKVTETPLGVKEASISDYPFVHTGIIPFARIQPDGDTYVLMYAESPEFDFRLPWGVVKAGQRLPVSALRNLYYASGGTYGSWSLTDEEAIQDLRRASYVFGWLQIEKQRPTEAQALDLWNARLGKWTGVWFYAVPYVPAEILKMNAFEIRGGNQPEIFFRWFPLTTLLTESKGIQTESWNVLQLEDVKVALQDLAKQESYNPELFKLVDSAGLLQKIPTKPPAATTSASVILPSTPSSAPSAPAAPFRPPPLAAGIPRLPRTPPPPRIPPLGIVLPAFKPSITSTGGLCEPLLSRALLTLDLNRVGRSQGQNVFNFECKEDRGLLGGSQVARLLEPGQLSALCQGSPGPLSAAFMAAYEADQKTRVDGGCLDVRRLIRSSANVEPTVTPLKGQYSFKLDWVNIPVLQEFISRDNFRSLRSVFPAIADVNNLHGSSLGSFDTLVQFASRDYIMVELTGRPLNSEKFVAENSISVNSDEVLQKPDLRQLQSNPQLAEEVTEMVKTTASYTIKIQLNLQLVGCPDALFLLNQNSWFKITKAQCQPQILPPQSRYSLWGFQDADLQQASLFLYKVTCSAFSQAPGLIEFVYEENK